MAKSPCENCQKETCPEKGCASWRKWFAKNWNDNIHRSIPKVPKLVWQYEHPDRVREMAPKNPEEMTAAEWTAMQMEANHAE